MTENKFYREYIDALSLSDREKAWKVAEKALASGMTAEETVSVLVAPALSEMLESMISKQTVSLARHYLATVIAGEITDRLLLLFKQSPDKPVTVVLGTAYGDFHGLGRKIVGGFLRAHCFEVIDLGLNVPAGKFADAARASGADIIGVSSMMMHTALGEHGPRKIRRLLDEQDGGSPARLIVGGAPYLFNADLWRDVGADAWAENGARAVEVILSLLKARTP